MCLFVFTEIPEALIFTPFSLSDFLVSSMVLEITFAA